jgi:hypothetical protein
MGFEAHDGLASCGVASQQGQSTIAAIKAARRVGYLLPRSRRGRRRAAAAGELSTGLYAHRRPDGIGVVPAVLLGI